MSYGTLTEITRRLRETMRLEASNIDLKAYAADQMGFYNLLNEIGFDLIRQGQTTKDKAQAIAVLLRNKDAEQNFLRLMGVFGTDTAKKVVSEVVGEDDTDGDIELTKFIKRLREEAPEEVLEGELIESAEDEMLGELDD